MAICYAAFEAVRRLSVLNPCHETWGAMRGEGSARFCASCAKNVYDLSGLSEPQALAFLHELEGRGEGQPCVRLAAPEARRDAIGAHEASGGAGRAGLRPSSATKAPARFEGAVAFLAAVAVAGATAAGCTPSRPAAKGVGASAPAPLCDRDGDGVDDAHDACPDDPAEPGPQLTEGPNAGCPPQETVIGLVNKRPSGPPIVIFERGSAQPLPESRETIEVMAKALRERPPGRRVLVEGHASGDEADGVGLSEARARAVVKQLVAAGVKPGLLEARGLGPHVPPDAPSSQPKQPGPWVSFRADGCAGLR